MAIITRGAAPPVTGAAGPGPNLFMRFLNSLAEAQMRHAVREIARHSHLLPHELEDAGDSLDSRSEDKLPFIH
jgi:hypothetical protein